MQSFQFHGPDIWILFYIRLFIPARLWSSVIGWMNQINYTADNAAACFALDCMPVLMTETMKQLVVSKVGSIYDGEFSTSPHQQRGALTHNFVSLGLPVTPKLQVIKLLTHPQKRSADLRSPNVRLSGTRPVTAHLSTDVAKILRHA